MLSRARQWEGGYQLVEIYWIKQSGWKGCIHIHINNTAMKSNRIAFEPKSWMFVAESWQQGWLGPWFRWDWNRRSTASQYWQGVVSVSILITTHSSDLRVTSPATLHIGLNGLGPLNWLGKKLVFRHVRDNIHCVVEEKAREIIEKRLAQFSLVDQVSLLFLHL